MFVTGPAVAQGLQLRTPFCCGACCDCRCGCRRTGDAVWRGGGDIQQGVVEGQGIPRILGYHVRNFCWKVSSCVICFDAGKWREDWPAPFGGSRKRACQEDGAFFECWHLCSSSPWLSVLFMPAPLLGIRSVRQPFCNFLRCLSEMSSDAKRNFLLFVLGCPHLPPGGLCALTPPLEVRTLEHVVGPNHYERRSRSRC